MCALEHEAQLDKAFSTLYADSLQAIVSYSLTWAYCQSLGKELGNEEQIGLWSKLNAVCHFNADQKNIFKALNIYCPHTSVFCFGRKLIHCDLYTLLSKSSAS